MADIALKERQKKTTQKPSSDTWTVRGVPQESRTAALVASRKAGTTLGEWLGRAIHEHAKTVNQVPAPTNEDALKAILAQLEKRDAAMDELRNQVQELTAAKRGFFARLFG